MSRLPHINLRQDILAIFMPSLVLAGLFIVLSLFSSCIYEPGKMYYLDPLSSCRSGFQSLTLYHWFLLLVVLPALRLYRIGLERSDAPKWALTFVQVFVVVLVVLLVMFQPLLDLPFAANFK